MSSKTSESQDLPDERSSWVLKASKDSPSDENLLSLYKAIQDRQTADLGMLHRFTNYYVAALLALITAFLVTFANVPDVRVRALLVLLPLLCLLLVFLGKLMAFRFYRRYTEGRVRLTKLEFVLGLAAPLLRKAPPQGEQLWPDDTMFLPTRYWKQAAREDQAVFRTSDEFVQHRSTKYGVGLLTQLSFDLFGALAWLALLGYYAYPFLEFGEINSRADWVAWYIACSLAAVVAVFSCGAFHRLKIKFVDETP